MATLKLPKAPSVLFFFGLAGAGKSFVGDVAARATGRFLYHADDDLTDEMKKALTEKRRFTDGMRDEYFTIIAKRISELQKTYKTLIVTQGAYKRRNRRFLSSIIEDMEMVWVDADEKLILSRLQARSGILSAESFLTLKKDFEPPFDTKKVIINNSTEKEILAQLKRYYGDS
ncbi:AAA family ATPase [Chitinispirillales bacterium ANBcel5]|uniref:AAA family ATPase n=1 Tax=Cellulosispirillum alkaliphilum TaxID=3039283 RepID=UPI002A5848BF|nr:AAA family ATPase [Chitinispirillales bacterium ANBcel5]